MTYINNIQLRKKYLIIFFLIGFLLLALLSLIALKSFANVDNPIYKQLDLDLTPQEITLIEELQTKEIKVALMEDSAADKYILEDINKIFNFNFKFVHFEKFSDAFNAVQKGDLDLIGNVAYNLERAKLFAFSSPTNFDSSIFFTDDHHILDHMNGKKIATERATIWPQILKDNFKNSIVVEVDNVTEAYNLYKNHKVDVIFGNNEYYEYLITKDLSAIFLDNKVSLLPGSIAGTKNKMELLLSIISKYTQTAHYIEGLNDYQSNYFKTIEANYLKKKINELNIDKDHVYKVKLNRFPPFVTSQNGVTKSYVGIYPEIMAQVANLIGIKYKIVEDAQPVALYPTAEDFKKNQLDIIMPVIMNEPTLANYKEFEDVIYSISLYKDQNVLIKRADYQPKGKLENIGSLIYEKLGIYKDNSYKNFFQELYANKQIYVYDNYQDAIRKLKSKEVDFIASSESLFRNYVEEHKDFSVRIDDNIGLFSHSYLSIAFNKSKKGEDLASVISIALRQLDIDRVIDKYIEKIDYEKYYKVQANIIYRMFFISLLILAIIVFMLLRYKKALRTDLLCQTLNRVALNQDYPNGLKADETLIYIDINRFKKFNETYNHQVGDEILKHFFDLYSQREQSKRYRIYRIGSNEFVLICDFNRTKISVDDCAALFVRQNIYLEMTGLTYEISASIYILPNTTKLSTIDKYLSMVDIAMHDYQRKAEVKITIDHLKLQEYEDRLFFRKRIEHAIKTAEMIAHFQPIIDINTNQVVGVETLSRWQQEDGSFVPVSIYLPEAKAIGFESRIDEIALAWACKCYEALLKENLLNDMYISINASGQTLTKIGSGTIDLNRYPIPKSVLKIEILEDIVIDKISMSYVEEIISSGYKIAIDDFGAGNTSLQYMKESRFSTIKIDRSLVPIFDNLTRNSETVLESQVTMLKKLDKYIVVEGVENQEQLDYLKGIGVSNVQGYYFAKPMPLEELIQFIRARNNNSITH